MDKLDRWYHEQYNENNVVINWIRRNKKQNSIILDIGANVGVYAQIFLESGARHVDAYEPDDMMYEYGKGRCDDNIVYHKAGFSEVEGWLPFSHDPNPSNFGLHKIPDSAMVSAQKEDGYIKCITIDSLTKKYDIIKIDAEGHEKEILKGAKQYLMLHKPIVILEHERWNKQECHSIMEELGYTTKQEINEVNTVYGK